MWYEIESKDNSARYSERTKSNISIWLIRKVLDQFFRAKLNFILKQKKAEHPLSILIISWILHVGQSDDLITMKAEFDL